MPDSLMARLWVGLLATSPLEALAVLSGLVYVVLAVPRSRWCWVAGGFSSLIYVWLSARARLPMQSLLRAWYVGVAVYGFLRWSREVTTGVSLLSWRGHVVGIAASLLLAAAIARFLAAETQADWPHLDASTTVLSLFASWLTARAKLDDRPRPERACKLECDGMMLPLRPSTSGAAKSLTFRRVPRPSAALSSWALPLRSGRAGNSVSAGIPSAPVPARLKSLFLNA